MTQVSQVKNAVYKYIFVTRRSATQSSLVSKVLRGAELNEKKIILNPKILTLTVVKKIDQLL